MASGEPRIINDLEIYLREHPKSDATARVIREGVRSSLTCPMKVEGVPVGFLFFSSGETETYRDVHVDTYLVIANQVAVILQKSRLYHELLKTQEALIDANKKLDAKARIDGLTGIANRRHFDEAYALEWRRAHRNQYPLSVILIDIDYFKRYNDSKGHIKGDACLKVVATSIENSAQRAADLVGRFGGEEFVVLVPHADARQSGELAERIRAAVAELKLVHGTSEVCDVVTISLGVASGIPHGATSPDGLLIAADQALYRAKDNGRNRVETISAS